MNTGRKSRAGRRTISAVRQVESPQQPTAPRRLGEPQNHVAKKKKRSAKARAKQRTRYIVGSVGAGAVALVALFVTVLGGSSHTQTLADIATATISGPPGPEGVPLETGPLLAPASSAATGQTIDGIQCNSSEQVIYHVHTHLSVYVNGVQRSLPAGVGIVSPVAQQTAEGPFDSATNCYYWLHVHAQDGVIHIESPTARTYTLGEFFDIWNQPLTSNQIGSAHGHLSVFVNGRLVHENPRNVNLGSHKDIQIEVGTPMVTPKKVEWSLTQL